MTTVSTTPNRGTADAPEGATRRPWLALGSVLAGSFLHIFDVTVINVAVPSIRTDLASSPSAAEWLVAGYTLPFALLLITFGRLGDAVGRRRMVVLGSLSFTAASLLCAVAPSTGALLAGRVWQGASAAMLTPSVFPIIMLLFPGRRRPAALGLYSAVITLATVSGPLLGGLLVHLDVAGLGWRVIFLLNLPVGLFTTVAALRWLPRAAAASGARARLDAVSVLLATAGLLLVVFPLVEGPHLGWPWWAVGMPVVALPVLVTLVRRQLARERAGAFPLIAMALFRRTTFVAGTLANFLQLGAVSAFFLVLVIYLQTGLNRSPLEIGLILLGSSLGAGLSSAVTVRLIRRLGRPLLVTGASLMAAGTAGMLVATSLWGTATGSGVFAGCLAVIGIGMGMLSPPLYDYTLSGVPRGDAGSGSGVFATMTQVGSALGIAIVGALFFGVLTSGDPAPSAGRIAETGVTATAAQAVRDCLRADDWTESTAVTARRCAPPDGSGGPRLDRLVQTHRQTQFTSAFGAALGYQVLSYLAVAVLLRRFLPRRLPDHA